MNLEDIIEDYFPPDEFLREYSPSELKDFCERVAVKYAKEEVKDLLYDLQKSRSYARKWDRNKTEVEGFGRGMNVAEDIIQTKLEQKPE